MDSISLTQARRLTLHAGAGFAPAPSKVNHGSSKDTGPGKVAALVDRIGFVQIDTIHVVERAHHHVLWSRLPGYRKEWLDDAPVFEYWAHAAAFLPWQDFRHTLPRKERIRANGHDWFRADRAEAARVLERIRAEGALMARDFEGPAKAGSWWDWKPAKRALEYLFMAGDLMVRRQGFQKAFDLTERCVPPGLDTSTPSPGEHAQWYVARALDAWGLVGNDEIAYQREEHVAGIPESLRALAERGSIMEVRVEGQGDRPWWVRPELLVLADQPLPSPRKLRILSPFDPFLIVRKRMERLFSVRIHLECYLPAPRRTFGYFALPLLRGSEVVGLLDAKADREKDQLVVKALRYDGPPRGRPAFLAALAPALTDFAAFNAVAEVVAVPGVDLPGL